MLAALLDGRVTHELRPGSRRPSTPTRHRLRAMARLKHTLAGISATLLPPHTSRGEGTETSRARPPGSQPGYSPVTVLSGMRRARCGAGAANIQVITAPSSSHAAQTASSPQLTPSEFPRAWASLSSTAPAIHA